MSEQQSSCIAPVEKSGTVEYRTIERFPGYRFGSDGTPWSCWTNRGAVGDTWKPLSPAKHANGYLSVSIRTASGQRKQFSLHRLILEAFVGPCPAGCEARHFPDRDKTNNAISNLAWGTWFENSDDRKTHGTRATCETHGSHKMTCDMVREARARFAAGEKTSSLAKRYGVDHSTMLSALRRKTWKNVA